MLRNIYFPKWLRFRSVSIRISLIRNLVLLIVLTSGTLLSVTMIGAYRTVKKLSNSIIIRTADQTESELKSLFVPVMKNLLVSMEWGRAGMLDNTEPTSLNSIFIPLLEENQQISSMLIANDKGVEYLLLRIGDTWYNRMTRADTWGKNTLWYKWKDPKTLIDKYWKVLDYDPRRRPWYQGAIKSDAEGKIHWTEPYSFFTTKDPGITASVRWRVKGKNENTNYVIAFDVLLIDISGFTTKQHFSENGKLTVLTEDGEVLGLPRDKRFQSISEIKKSVLSQAEKLGITPVTDAVQRWKLDKTKSQEPFRFSIDGNRWWAGFKPFSLEDRTFWIGVMVPESDFLGNMIKLRNIIIIIVISATVSAILMALLLARKYSHPLEKLAEQSRRIRKLDLNTEIQISSRLAEVNQLTETHGQMLSALQSFAKYVPVDVVRELFRQGEVARIGGRTEHLTVLFTDIRGFTSIAESMSPEKLTSHMAEYFDEVLNVLHINNATVDKLIGDAVCAFWGAPKPDPHHAKNAVMAVIQCSKRINEYNCQWEKRGLPALPTCFGLDTGNVVVGNVGSRTRLSYTAMGDTVNLASRIESLNRFYGTDVLATREVKEKAGKEFIWRCVDCVSVKGKCKSVEIYELLGHRDEVAEETLIFSKSYEEALALYQSKQFRKALKSLRDIERYGPQAPSVKWLAQICQEHILTPPK